MSPASALSGGGSARPSCGCCRVLVNRGICSRTPSPAIRNRHQRPFILRNLCGAGSRLTQMGVMTLLSRVGYGLVSTRTPRLKPGDFMSWQPPFRPNTSPLPPVDDLTPKMGGKERDRKNRRAQQLEPRYKTNAGGMCSWVCLSPPQNMKRSKITRGNIITMMDTRQQGARGFNQTSAHTRRKPGRQKKVTASAVKCMAWTYGWCAQYPILVCTGYAN